jgi:hypothetical protein
VPLTFGKYRERRFCRWSADRGKRQIVPGTVWGDGQTLTHELAGLVVAWPTLRLKPAEQGFMLRGTPSGRMRRRTARAHGCAEAR